jgi:flagellar motor switch/type III secretory pathway protein FliN
LLCLLTDEVCAVCPKFLDQVLDMAEPASVVAPQNTTVDPDAWAQVLPLPCRLAVDVPLPGFTVADALRLRPGSVINSRWQVGTDVPLRLNGELIAHGEFEVVGNHLALRLTELV